MKYTIVQNAPEYVSQLLQMKAAYESYLSTIGESDMLRGYAGAKDTDICGGLVAIDGDGKVLAWLKISEDVHDFRGEYLSISSFHDLDLKKNGSVLKSLYGVEAGNAEKGHCEYKVYCSAYDADLLRLWHELGFGIEQAYGHAKLVDLKSRLMPRDGIEIEELNVRNKNEFGQFYSLVAATHAMAPTFAGISEKYLLDLKEGFEGIIDDTDVIGFLAFRNGKAVGYQVWSSGDNKVIELAVSGTKQEERNKGVGTALTAYGVNRALGRGYEECMTDWRTANPESSSFWPSIGFKPYKYRLVRRLSERLIRDARETKDKYY